MSYSAKQWRAINHFLKKNNARPELSAFPMLRYTDKATGKSAEMHITNIEDFYDADRARDKQAAREEAKANKKAANVAARGRK